MIIYDERHMATSSTVMFNFALLAGEKSYLPSSTFGNTSTAGGERGVRRKIKSLLQIHFKLDSCGSIQKMFGFFFP